MGKSQTPFLCFSVLPSEEGQYVRGILRNRFGMSIGLVRALKHDGCVKVNEESVAVRHSVRAGDEVRLYLPASSESVVEPEPVPLTLLFEDRHVLVVDKPAGLLVHPAGTTLHGTLANGVAHHLLERGELPAAGAVTRLDRGTSGLVLFAKHPHAHHRLTQSLQSRDVRRTYFALVAGDVSSDGGQIEAPIRRVPGQITRREVNDGGRVAVTHFSVLQRYNVQASTPSLPHSQVTSVRLTLATGRTHQIRVHMKHLGHPVVGDPMYGHPLPGILERQALHAQHLEFTHPIDDCALQFESALPTDITRLLSMLTPK